MARFLQTAALIVILISCIQPAAEVEDISSSSQTPTDIEEARVELFICKCSHLNKQTGVIEDKLDTLGVKTLEEAELECSNYETTDEPGESIDCKVVVEEKHR